MLVPLVAGADAKVSSSASDAAADAKVTSASAAAAPTAATPDSSEPWKPYKSKHGLVIERRPVAGSRFFEYRASFVSTVTPTQAIDHLWSHITDPVPNLVKKREVIRQSTTEVVLYDQIQTPVVSDRDYTLVLRKLSSSDGQKYQLTYEIANHLGPPVQPKFVRVQAIRGSWTIESLGVGNGGTKLTYTSYSEPGGSIPAFLVHGAQAESVMDGVLRVQDRLSRLPTQ